GVEVNDRIFTSSDFSNLSGNPTLDLIAGAYTLTVDASNNHTGSYAFRLLDFSAATPIVPGTPVSVTLPNGNETQLYRFDALAVDQISLDRQALATGSVFWRLIDPFGGLTFSNSFATSPTLNLPFAGSYTLLVEGPTNATGPASLTFNVASHGHVDPVPL